MLPRREALLCGLAALVSAQLGQRTVFAAQEAVSKLSDLLSNSPSFKVRVQAASILGRMKDPRAGQALARAASADPHPLVRVLALRLLAKNAANDRNAAPQARVALNRGLDDRDASVRRQAQSSLAEMDARSAASRSRSGVTVVAVGSIGDRTGRATAAFRDHLRSEIVALLGREPRVK